MAAFPRTFRRIPWRNIPAIPALFAAAALVVGLGWALATGPLNGPDESAHVAYTQYLAETGHGPQRSTGQQTDSTQMLRLLIEGNLAPIVGHQEGAPTWSAIGQLDADLGDLPKSSRADGSGPNPLAANPPLYYFYEALAYRLSLSADPLNRLMVLRVANVALFVLTVILAWLLACEVFAATWPRVLMTGLVAFQPKLGFMAGVVNSDTLLVTLTTGFLLASARLIKRGPTARRVAAVALFGAAGAMTHGRGLALVPAGFVVLALGVWPLRRSARRVALLSAQAGAILVGGTLGAVFWTRAHNGGAAFGGELETVSHAGFNTRQFLSYVWQFYFDKLSFMSPMLGPPYGYRQMYINTFFGSFGSLEVDYPLWVYDLIQVAALLGFAALGAAVLLHWDAVRRNVRFVIAAIATFGSFFASLHIAGYRALEGGGMDPLITGRYLLPCVALYALAASWTISVLARRAGPWIAGVLLSTSALAAIAGIGLTAWRFGA